MPRLTINLDPYKEEITTLLDSKRTNADIREYLNDLYGLQIADKTLRRRLKEWKISTHTWIQDTPALRDRVISLFYNGLNDRQLYEALRIEGYMLGEEALVQLRLTMNLKHYEQGRNDQQAADELARGRIAEELTKGVIEGYGRGLLYTHFQQLGVHIARYYSKA
jgi:Clr5 domain